MLQLHDIALCSHGKLGLITQVKSENGETLYSGVHLSEERMEEPWQSKDPVRIISSDDLLRAHQYGVVEVPELVVSMIRKKSGTLPDFSAARRNNGDVE